MCAHLHFSVVQVGVPVEGMGKAVGRPVPPKSGKNHVYQETSEKRTVAGMPDEHVGVYDREVRRSV